MPHSRLLLALLSLLCVLSACDDPDPVTTCDEVVQDHCAKLAMCVFTPPDTEACIEDTRAQLGCANATDTTSSLDRCQRELGESTCASYSMLPIACRDAFTSN
jgi:hypothetical protein